MRAIAALVVLAGCGRIGFGTDVVPTAITITADNDYVVAAAQGNRIVATVANVQNLGPEGLIADCPLGNGPERWDLTGLPPHDAFFIWAYDETPAFRGLLAQFETREGPVPVDTSSPICASGSTTTDPVADLTTMIASCNAGTASASGGWGPAVTGVWDNGYTVCPGVFGPTTPWIWWDNGAADPLASDPASGMIVVRIPVGTP